MSMQFIDRFSDDADLYARARPFYPAALLEAILQHVKGRDFAWDCGTGNGQAAVQLKAHFDRVVATDPSEEQIRNALYCEGVEYGVGQAEGVDLPDHSVDLITVAQAMHWFDLRKFYGEARRILKADGALAVFGYSWFYISPEIDAEVARSILAEIEPYWSINNRLLWDGYRGIDFPLIETRLPPMAIHLAWSVTDLIDYVSTWSATREAIRQKGSDFLKKAESALYDLWGGDDRIRPVTMPLFTLFGHFAKP